MLSSYGAQLGRKREDDMEARYGQYTLHLPFDPACLGQRLALGTVAVPAGVVRRLLVATGHTTVQMPPERSGAAAHDVAHRPLLLEAQQVALGILGAVGEQHVGDFESR
jgi:hypothetical protein